MNTSYMLFILLPILACAETGQNTGDKIKVLIVDGINNHDWKNTTKATKATLESTGLFKVETEHS